MNAHAPRRSGHGLVMEAPPARGFRPGPDQPTVLLQGFAKPLVFDSLDALARYIHRERGARGFRLTAGVGGYDGSDTFALFRVAWLRPDDGEDYAFSVAVQDRHPARLEAALARTNPDQPEGLR